MITPMIVAFKESFEMLLIIVLILVCINKINTVRLSKYIYIGSILGFIVSVLIAVLLGGQVVHMSIYLEKLLLGPFMIFLAVLIIYSIVWVNTAQKPLSLDTTRKNKIKLKSISLSLLSFITIFIKSIFIIKFIFSLSNSNIMYLTFGISAGILASTLLVFIVFKSSQKLNIYILFTIINIFLILIGGNFFGKGLATIFSSVGESIHLAGQLIFTIPLLYLFLKRDLKKYMGKK